MKNKTMRRVIALALAFCLTAGILAGCGGNSKKKGKGEHAAEIQAGYDEDGNFNPRLITEGKKFTIAIPASTLVKDFKTNNMTQIIEESLGVELEFMVLPSADYTSKLSTMIMGGDELPDIIFNASGYENWIEEGVLADLSEYYDNEDVSANIHAACDRADKDFIKYLSRPEGGIYAVPKINDEIYAEVSQKIWVYKPWLDKLGLDVPKTLDEYFEACKMVVQSDMNGNGKADEIGLTGTGLGAWFNCLMSSFTYAYESNYRQVDDKGKVSLAYTTDEWKEGVKYIKKFFDEGLIPEVTLTQSTDQYNTMLYASKPMLFSFAGYNYTGTDMSIRKDYVAIPALKGPKGAQYACARRVVPEAGAVITSDCKDPLAAFLVCDFMCSQEMSIMQRYGEQGVDWDYWEDAKENLGDESEFVPTFDGYDIVFYPYDMINFWNAREATNACYRQSGPYILDRATASGAAVWVEAGDKKIRELAELEVATAGAAVEQLKNQPKNVFDYAPMTMDELNEVADVRSALSSYVDEMTSAYLVGKKDINKDWSAFQKEIKNIGSDKYLKTLQKAYDRVHK